MFTLSGQINIDPHNAALGYTPANQAALSTMAAQNATAVNIGSVAGNTITLAGSTPAATVTSALIQPNDKMAVQTALNALVPTAAGRSIYPTATTEYFH